MSNFVYISPGIFLDQLNLSPTKICEGMEQLKIKKHCVRRLYALFDLIQRSSKGFLYYKMREKERERES